MKKLIALITIIALLLCGCSLFGQTEERGSLSEKLSGLELAEGETEATPEPTPTLEPMPEPTPEEELLAYEQVDPFGFMTSGTHTEDGAVDEFGLTYNETRTMSYRESLESPNSNVYTTELAENLPGTHNGVASATFSTGTKYDDNSSLSYVYTYDFDDDLSAEDIAATYIMVVDVLKEVKSISSTSTLQVPWNDPGSIDSFTDEDLVDMLQQPNIENVGTARTAWRTGARTVGYSVVLNRFPDESVDLQIRFDFPGYSYSGNGSSSEQEGEPAAASESSGSSSSGNSSSGGGVSFSLTTDDDAGQIELVDYGATPNSSGGYDCYVTIKNGMSEMTKLGIEIWLYGGYEEADIFPLAEPAAFHAGASETFYFDIPYEPASGEWEVLVKYRFW